MSTRTPWGPSQHSEKIARGITFHSTAGHGGFHVSKALLATMPAPWRMADGWYEEDVEATLVILAFPLYFTQAQWESALRSAKNWMPDELRAAGYSVREEESYTLRERSFTQQHKGAYMVLAAWGDWHQAVPPGFIGVMAKVEATGEKAYFLIPKEEYPGPLPHGLPFIVDPSRHQPWSPHP